MYIYIYTYLYICIYGMLTSSAARACSASRCRQGVRGSRATRKAPGPNTSFCALVR